MHHTQTAWSKDEPTNHEVTSLHLPVYCLWALGGEGERYINCCINNMEARVNYCPDVFFLQVLFLLEMMKLPWNVLNPWFTWQRTNLIMSLLKNQSYLNCHQKKGKKCFPGFVHLTLIFLLSWRHIFVFCTVANIPLFTEWCPVLFCPFNWSFVWMIYILSLIYNRELKHRRFWATDVIRKSRLLLFDVYFTLLIQKVKL